MESALEVLLVVAMWGLLTAIACGCSADDGLAGNVTVDGSSTVFLITEAVAEEFMEMHPDIQVTVGISGTGGGFERFCGGKTDINNASRPIASLEIETCSRNGIEFIELPIAYVGISVVVNPQNDWVDNMTLEELQEIWEPSSSVQKWSEARSEWPSEELVLMGPGTDSGTFDYLTEAVMGEIKSSRPDYMASENDYVLVTAIADSQYSLGYLGYAYYIE